LTWVYTSINPSPAAVLDPTVGVSGPIRFSASATAQLNPEACVVELPLIKNSVGEYDPGIGVFQGSNGCANIWLYGRTISGLPATDASHAQKIELYASDNAGILSFNATETGVAFAISVDTLIEISASHEVMITAPSVFITGDLILRSPNGNRWALRVSDGGVLSVVGV
jgi:hypothetical protein